PAARRSGWPAAPPPPTPTRRCRGRCSDRRWKPCSPLAPLLLLLRGLLRLGVDPGLLALLRGNRGRRVGQRVNAAAGLRESDDLADGVHPGQQRHDAVPAEGDAAV